MGNVYLGKVYLNNDAEQVLHIAFCFQQHCVLNVQSTGPP